MKNYFLTYLYHFLITLSLPIAVFRLYWKSQKNPNYRKRLFERFSIHLPSFSDGVWVHSVSVGEVIAILPLIEKLLANHIPVLITTTTPTGSKMVRERLGERVTHCYLPFDQILLVRHFFKKIMPKVAVFVETEIWANYLSTLKKQDIPTFLINARLSEKSFNSYMKLGGFTRRILTCFNEVACQNKISQQRFLQLGAKATILGNIKFDLTPPSNLDKKRKQLTHILGEHPFILAASTHKGEDEIILQAYQNSPYANSHRLIIAPRHPERSKDILNLFQNSPNSAILYSHTSTPLAHKHTVIIDTLGELLYFYSLADFAIIGGSFVPHGGHNPLEAALFSTPCLIGEHYFNFESLVDEMTANEAIIITTKKQLFSYRSGEYLDYVGNNAKQFLTNNQGATERYAQLILQSLGNKSKPQLPTNCHLGQ